MVNKLGLDAYDALAVLGFGALECGIAHWSGAAAWVVGGVILLVVGIWPAPRRRIR